MPLKNSISVKYASLVCLVFAILILSSCQIINRKPLITHTFPLTGTQLSSWGWVGVAFSQPMDTHSVEASFSLSPDMTGVFFWQENAVWFRPSTAYDLESEYQARLAGDLQTADGQIFPVDITWNYSIRQPDLIYTVPLENGGEIWRASSAGSDSQQLSVTGGNVIEFIPDRTGNWIAFSVQNESDGSDIWIMDRDGENQQMLVNCGQDVCGEPAWSMDRLWIAFTRETYHTDSGGYQSAQIWTVDVQTKETSQLYQSDIAFGHSPSFSPDGNKLASYDTTQTGIRVLNLTSSQESLIPRILPGVGDWSQDGSKIVFTDVVAAENEPYVVIYIVDLATQTVEPAFDEAISDTDFSQPRWAPDSKWLAVSLRPINAEFTKALWVLKLNGDALYPVATDPSATHSSYSWDPWGTSLVYQRLAFSSSDTNPSIWLWDWESMASERLIEIGGRPEWLP